jgi:hypothetical protein
MISSVRVKGVEMSEHMQQSGLVVILLSMFAAVGCGDNSDNPGLGDRVVWFVDGDSYSFGQVPAGSTSSHGFEIRTEQGVSVENEGLSVDEGASNPFNIADTNCGDVIGDRCTVDVQFAPAQSGGWGNRLLLDYVHNGQSKKVLIVISGEGT